MVYWVQYSSTVLQWYTTVVLLGCIPYTVLQHGTYTTVLHLPIGTCTHTHPPIGTVPYTTQYSAVYRAYTGMYLGIPGYTGVQWASTTIPGGVYHMV